MPKSARGKRKKMLGEFLPVPPGSDLEPYVVLKKSVLVASHEVPDPDPSSKKSGVRNQS